MTLKEYFMEMYKLRANKRINDKDLNLFLKKMELSIKSVQRIIDQKVEEYIKNEK